MRLFKRRRKPRREPGFAEGGLVPPPSDRGARGLPPRPVPGVGDMGRPAEVHVHVHLDGNEIERAILRDVARAQSGGGGPIG